MISLAAYVYRYPIKKPIRIQTAIEDSVLEEQDMIILDAAKYRLNVKTIALMTEDKTKQESIDFIGHLAIATSVPIIIVGHYLAEIYGYTPDLIERIKRLNKFYGIDETIGLACGKDPTVDTESLT